MGFGVSSSVQVLRDEAQQLLCWLLLPDKHSTLLLKQPQRTAAAALALLQPPSLHVLVTVVLILMDTALNAAHQRAFCKFAARKVCYILVGLLKN
jgi:hypothetical protein